MKENARARLALIASMVIFGTIGIFRTYIPLPSGMIAFSRGLVGMLFLLAVMALKRERFDKKAVKSNFWKLCLSGCFIGINWILLFEAYRYTTVATATLCYYMAPLFVMLVSPFLLKEKLRIKQIVCMTVAFSGMVLVSGVFSSGGVGGWQGIALGLGAAAFYATVVLLNKTIGEISAFSKTAVQLGFAALIILPYTLIAERGSASAPDLSVLLLLLLVGVLHTGVAYTLYFGSMGKLRAQTVALFSYLDPIVAILLSVLFLHEPMTLPSVIGAVLILGSTMVSEVTEGR